MQGGRSKGSAAKVGKREPEEQTRAASSRPKSAEESRATSETRRPGVKCRLPPGRPAALHDAGGSDDGDQSRGEGAERKRGGGRRGRPAKGSFLMGEAITQHEG